MVDWSRSPADRNDVVRLLVVEDEPLFRELLQRTLSTEPGLTVVGMAADGSR